MNNTSSKPAEDMLKEIQRVLDLNGITYVIDELPFLLLCTHGDIQFEMEASGCFYKHVSQINHDLDTYSRFASCHDYL